MVAIRLILSLLLAAPIAHAQSESVIPEAPQAVKRVMVRMPVWAMRYEQPGEAVVGLSVDEEGRAHDAVILAEYPRNKEFGAEAVDSVKRWTFQPGLPGRFKVTVKFHMKNAARVTPPEGKTFEDTIPVAPAPLDREPPIYPLMAQQKPLEGVVQLLVAMEAGRVVRSGVVESGDVSDVFGDAAFNAARKWRFAETLNGLYLINIPFTLEGLKRGEFTESPKSYRP